MDVRNSFILASYESSVTSVMFLIVFELRYAMLTTLTLFSFSVHLACIHCIPCSFVCYPNHLITESSNCLQGIGTTKKGKNSEEKLTEPSPDSIDIEASSPECEFRKRKTSQNLHHYGSFFLRVGAIGTSVLHESSTNAIFSRQKAIIIVLRKRVDRDYNER